MPITDKLNKVSNGSQPLPAQLSAPKSAGATSASLSSATGWNTTTAKHIRMYQTQVVNGQTVPNQSTICYYKATLSGTTLSNLQLIWSATGADQDYPSGATVDLSLTAGWADDLIDSVSTQHNHDGTHGAVTATSVTAPSLISTGDIQHRSVSLETIRSELEFDFVASGLVWSGDSYGSTRNASMTAGVVYIAGKRVAISAVTARTLTASKDTYVDVGVDGVIDYNEVANNAASPALAASHVRIAIIVTGASNIANVGSVNQGQEDKVLPIVSSVPYAVTDSLGNLICPRDPQRSILGYRQITSNFSTAAISPTQVTGLSAPVIVPTGRKVRVSFSFDAINNSTGPINVYASVWDGTPGSGTRLKQSAGYQATAGGQQPVRQPQAITTPTSTSKTFNAGVYGGAGNTTVAAASDDPAYILVELV